MTGKVYLVGAGPGDVELLTLKAVRALRGADVALVDDLVSREVLQFLPQQARVIEVGKRKGCRATPQAFIERLMVRFARRGLQVARVKGGDPFMFGRGGEEVQRLHDAGIDVEVVSGITSGMAAPATLGIPLTHRDCAHGVTFITGHASIGARFDWDAIARSGATLVIYMGLTRVRDIAALLMGAGMPRHTPAAAIQDGTLATQRQVISTLDDIADAIHRARLGSPCLIVIGAVVECAAIGRAASSGIRQVA
ncbi:MAG: uroporphyrinogen-III C-methyltransferase [Betaproteobacteria bacterium]